MIATSWMLMGPLAVAGLTSTDVDGYVLELRRETGEALRYVHSVDHVLAVQRIETRVPGRTEPGVLRPRLEAKGGARVEFVDELQAADAGAPTRMRRRYLNATATIEMLDVRPDADDVPDTPLSRAEFTSPLEGVSIVHVRQSDGVGWGRHYDAREARESLLPWVSGDLDWAAILPSSAVEIGGTWRVEPSKLGVLLAPAAEMAWRGTEGADPELVRSFGAGLAGNVHLGLGSGATGEVEATLHEVKVAGADKRAIVLYRFTLSLTGDHTEMARRRMTENERGMGVDVGSASSVRTLEGTASLEWDLIEGRPVAAAGTADENFQLTIEVRARGREGRATQTLVTEGPFAFDLQCAPAESEDAKPVHEDR